MMDRFVERQPKKCFFWRAFSLHLIRPFFLFFSQEKKLSNFVRIDKQTPNAGAERYGKAPKLTVHKFFTMILILGDNLDTFRPNGVVRRKKKKNNKTRKEKTRLTS